MKKKIFISFPMEDEGLRNLLVGQSKNERINFEFIDESVKEPWSSCWKTHCREKIKKCDGVIAIVTSNTKKAEGQLWEIKCSKEEKIPILGIYGYKNQKGWNIPLEYGYINIIDWDNSKIENWIERI